MTAKYAPPETYLDGLLVVIDNLNVYRAVVPAKAKAPLVVDAMGQSRWLSLWLARQFS